MAVVTAGFTLPASAAGAEDAGQASTARGGHQATQAALDGVVQGGPPGAIALAQRGHDVWAGRAGTADLATGRQPRADDRFRVGSITKTFVATVVLQLEAEGRLSLDDTVDHWLPGVVRGNGHDGTKITLRQLLNHTSGIYSYTDDADFKRKEFSTDFLQHRYDTWTQQQVVQLAMTHQPTFDPGTGWSYSDTNYVLAAMVIQKATGHSYAREIERRILRPLHMDSTTLPGTRARVPGPSGRAYSKLTGELAGPADPNSPTYDVTELNPSLAGAAGEMVSNTRDLNRFYQALLSGRLLHKRQLAEMTTTEPIKEMPTVSYGLGLMKIKLSCGIDVWGHNGGIQGSISQTMATTDGGHVLSLNFNGDWNVHEQRVVEAEFCGA
ncbi:MULTISPECIES: serine hydrolase [unclassified Streptomyces]|uniref:serine hydrolase domain-containing protein n=1 Tax=unclassified Streptomyces TaxID=2593676 RepID=UPI001BE96B3C|nr:MULTISPECIES: serine hydrolase domain-containing protein [unclassified Streptomyces]MBT2404944.1 beta-lactamase family protein [Streptomyces sp. ISL-21]MBT2611327.1 beta-lactamase family protein [Streptomyces sp. ISL-87]